MSLPQPPREITGDGRNRSPELRAARNAWITAARQQGASAIQIAEALGISRNSATWNLRMLGLPPLKSPLSAKRLKEMGLKVGSAGKAFDDMPEAARDRLVAIASRGDGSIATALADHFTKSFSEKRA